MTEDYFMSIIDSGLIGGAFGLLELTVRMSAREILGYTVPSKYILLAPASISTDAM